MTSVEAVTAEGRSAGGDQDRSALAGPAGKDAPLVRLEMFEGPLDLLLETAREHRLDLNQLSLAALIEQFIAATEAAGSGASLAQRGDWLVMVAWLVLLKSRLLLPIETPERQDAEDAAAALRRQVLAREQTQRAAAWLEVRPRLGRDVFRRGAPDLPASRRRSGPAALLEACMTVLTQSERHLAVRRPAPRPRFWTMPQALARIAALLPVLPEGSSLLRYLPGAAALADPRRADSAVQPVQQRGAVATTLVAGLEMARQGLLSLEQAEPNGDIRIFASETGAAAVAALQDSGSS